MSNSTPATILVVDDDLVMQLLMERYLKSLGLTYHIVSNGLEALTQYEQRASNPSLEPFSLIFMDCQMPKMDGYEATQAIRKYETQHSIHKRVPIIGMSSYVLTENEEKCKKSGMNCFYSKPIDRTLVETVLQNWLGRSVLAHR